MGAKRRVSHDCGSGKVLLVENKTEGYAAWCHRCSDKGFWPHPAPTLAERLERLSRASQVEAAATMTLALPQPMNLDPSTWPLEARVWLYKAGLSNDKIKELGVYYWGAAHRVVMPVYDDQGLVYWQARGFERGRPKYVNPPIDKARLMARFGTDGPIVLTEDILSAVRVGGVARGWAVLGTSLSIPQINMLVGAGPVLIWMDPDGPGRKASGRMLRALRQIGIPCATINTDKDPKLHTYEQISHALQEGSGRCA